tara:strand:+ start:5014 stop:7098 length:2085 start_codon:yes stop_codon:yes gene_type:complete
MINMTWQNILKIIGIPKRSMFVPHIVINREEFENTLNKLKELETAPTKLQGVLTADKGKGKTHADYYKQGVEEGFKETTLSEEESKTLFDEMLKIIAEKMKEHGGITYLTIEKVRELLSQAQKAQKDGDKDKVAELVLEITENSPKRRQFWGDNVPERDRLKALQQFLEGDMTGSHLSFKNPPTSKKILQDFAKLLEGKYQNDKIYLDIDGNQGFIRLLRPTEAQQKEFQEFRENNDGRLSDEEKLFNSRFEFYNKNIKSLGVSVVIGSQSKLIDPRDLEVSVLNVRGAKYEVVDGFNERSVEKYISIVQRLKGSVRLWNPSTSISKAPELNKFSTGAFIPQELFLDRTSENKNSLVLNPYASIILGSSFSNNWFESFYDTLRTNEVLTDVEVERLLIDDISSAITNNEEESSMGIRTASFNRLDKIRNLKLTNAPKKRLNEAIRDVISDNSEDDDIGGLITRKKLSVRREQLQLLKKYFTIKEGTPILSALEEIYGEEDVEPIYYTSSGTETEKESARYMNFEVYGEEIGPENIKEQLEEEQLPDSENPIAEMRETLLRPTNFVEYIKSISKQEKLMDFIKNATVSANYLDQIKPKNSLIFLNEMSERVGNNEMAEVFNKIDSDPQSSDVDALLEDLNRKIPELLRKSKEELVLAFKNRLEFFAKNYGQTFTRIQVPKAIKAFTKANMLREVS